MNSDEYQAKLEEVKDLVANQGAYTEEAFAEEILSLFGITRPAPAAGNKSFHFIGECAEYELIRIIKQKQEGWFTVGTMVQYEDNEAHNNNVTHLSGDEYLVTDDGDEYVIKISQDELAENWRPGKA